jgi:hypothetical protein
MRFFELGFKTRALARDPIKVKEAIVKASRHKRTVLQIPDGLSLRVQHALYALDDCFAMRQKKLQKLDMRLKRHLVKAPAHHNCSCP